MKEGEEYICTLDGEEIEAEWDKGSVTVEINSTGHILNIRKKQDFCDL